MISLDDTPAWGSLSHAYGAAADIPALLRKARSDHRPSHVPDSPWFALWSALCHQGDIYSASYAAVPHLADLASESGNSPRQFDPLHLAACIELARLEGRGPDLTPDLAPAYHQALGTIRSLTAQSLRRSWPEDYRQSLDAGLAALSGDAVTARRILDADVPIDSE